MRINSNVITLALGLTLQTTFSQSMPAEDLRQVTQIIKVDHGAASFHAATTVSAIEISGTSNALQARVQYHREPNGLIFDRIEAWLPVNTLATGMALRDEHMRKHIFTTNGRETPDLRFESGRIACPEAAPRREATCLVAGMMTIRGTVHAFSISLKLRPENGGAAFRVFGEGVVKLSDYGIEQPTQLGVKILNEVRIRLDFNGKVQPASTAVIATVTGQ